MDNSIIRKKLIEYGRKSIQLEDLASLIGVGSFDTENLYKKVSDLVAEGFLSEVKSADTNGNKTYPLYKKYRITACDKEKEEKAIALLKTMHPKLRSNGYLANHPKEFMENYEILEALNRFLFSDSPKERISRKERSYEIFNYEKQLDDSKVKALLGKLEITEDDLYFYDTPEYCFHDFIPERKSDMTLLVCENKEIWFNIRRIMFVDGVKSVLGVAIDGVVYGNGNKVSQKQGALTEYVRFMGSPNVSFLYWGDIDREGMEIFKRARENNPRLKIALFVPGYEKMIERARGTALGNSPSSRMEDKDFSCLLDGFKNVDRDYLVDVLAQNKLIPQEIVSYVVLRRG